MQYRNSKSIAYKLLGTRAIAAVYQGVRLVWQAVRSCFGSGVWVSRKPWIGSEKWKNNK